MVHQVRSHARHASEPNPAFAQKIRRFKAIYGEPAESPEDVFFEMLKEGTLVSVDRPAPSDERLRHIAKELGEEFDEEIGKWVEEETRKHPPMPRDPEFEAYRERLHEDNVKWETERLEDRLTNLDRNLERRRTERGRQEEIGNVKRAIHQYERELGRKV